MYILLIAIAVASATCLVSFMLRPLSRVSTPQSASHAHSVKLVVLVDNEAYTSNVETAWGLSIYVEVNGTRILFDTGPDPYVLKRNAEALGVDLSKVDFVVISHGHGDHIGGLKLFAYVKPNLTVYIPRGSGLREYVKELGLKPVEVNETLEIAKNVFVVKPLYGPPVEEALAIRCGKGLILVVGCSHPGVDRLAEQAVRDTGSRLYMVIGGFHLWGSPESVVAEAMEKLISLGAEKIYPLHCSGDEVKRYLMEKHPNVYGCGGAGLEITISS